MGRVDGNSGERAFSIQRCVRMLHQNKHVAREEGLKDLIAALEVFVPSDEITDNQNLYEQALDRCFSFISKIGSDKERKHAYRAIGIYALNVVGSKAQILLDRLFDLDRLSAEIAPSSASEAEKAVAAINCLVAVTLVCAKKAAAAKRTLKAICEVIDKNAVPQVLAAALSAWTLLLPRAGNLRAMTPFKVIAKHLGADDPAVRMAAGEALAVCVELDHLPHQPDPPQPQWYRHRYYTPEPKPEHRPSLESRVAELAAGVDAHKKEHAEERILFRRIKDLLEGNPPRPDDDDDYSDDDAEDEDEDSSGFRVKVNKTTWAKLVLLNFLRQYLGEEGFAAHSQLNRPLFRDTLGLTTAAEQKKDLPALEMKQLRNCREKQRTKDIKKDRQNKNKQYC
jgi:hypothetical protein